MKKKYLPTLICGFAAAVLTTIPGLKNISCCLIIPFAAGFSLYLHQKINGLVEKISTGTAIFYGFLTGLFAALFGTFFEVLITYITRSNEIVNALPEIESLMKSYGLENLTKASMELLYLMVNEIKEYGFSMLFTFFVLVNNLTINILFGILGSSIGMAILNKRNFEELK